MLLYPEVFCKGSNKRKHESLPRKWVIKVYSIRARICRTSCQTVHSSSLPRAWKGVPTICTAVSGYWTVFPCSHLSNSMRRAHSPVGKEHTAPPSNWCLPFTPYCISFQAHLPRWGQKAKLWKSCRSLQPGLLLPSPGSASQEQDGFCHHSAFIGHFLFFCLHFRKKHQNKR